MGNNRLLPPPGQNPADYMQWLTIFADLIKDIKGTVNYYDTPDHILTDITEDFENLLKDIDVKIAASEVNLTKVVEDLVGTINDNTDDIMLLMPPATNVTQNTSTLQELLDKALNTKKRITIKFTGGRYDLNECYIHGNTTLLLDSSTTLIKSNTAEMIFMNARRNIDSNFTSYNGNGNIIIDGGNFEGHLMSMIHGYNITIRNCKVSKMGQHAIEINASKNVLIENCEFTGVGSVPVDRNYVEIIQLDSCTYNGFPRFPEGSPCFDGTPLDGITIRNCSFASSITPFNNIYTAIGSHGKISSTNKNIFIENCTFESCSFAGITLACIENVNIKNNTFKNCYRGIYSRQLVPYDYRSVLNANITDNLFTNCTAQPFRTDNVSPDTLGEFNKGLIFANNIIDNNAFTDVDSLFITKQDDIKIYNNTTRNNRRLVYLESCNNCYVYDNESSGFTVPVVTEFLSKNVDVYNNTLINASPSFMENKLLYAKGGDNIRFHNNKAYNCSTTASYFYFTSFLNGSVGQECTNISSYSNVIFSPDEKYREENYCGLNTPSLVSPLNNKVDRSEMICNITQFKTLVGSDNVWNTALTEALKISSKVRFPSGTYIIDNYTLSSDVEIFGDGDSTIIKPKTNGTIFRISGSLGGPVNVTADIPDFSANYMLSSVVGLAPNDFVQLMGQRDCMCYADSGDDWTLGYSTPSVQGARFGEFMKIKSINTSAKSISCFQETIFPNYFKDDSRETSSYAATSSMVRKCNFISNVKIHDFKVIGHTSAIFYASYGYKCEVYNVNQEVSNYSSELTGVHTVWSNCFQCSCHHCSYIRNDVVVPGDHYYLNIFKVISSMECGFEYCYAENATQAGDFSYRALDMCTSLCYFNNCTIKNSTQSGMTTHGGTYKISIQNNKFYNSSQAIACRTRSSIISGNMITNDMISGNGRAGVILYEGHAKDCTISNNSISNCYEGVSILDAADIDECFTNVNSVISNNTITTCYQGIVVRRSTVHKIKTPMNLVIVNNNITLSNLGYIGINLNQYTNGVQIHDNSFKNYYKTKLSGIFAGKDVYNIDIYDNTFVDFGTAITFQGLYDVAISVPQFISIHGNRYENITKALDVSRTLQIINNDSSSLSVKDFGAKGDYYTDDTNAIQLANDYCEQRGYSLRFPKGVYACTNGIDKKCTWHGEGSPKLGTFPQEDEKVFLREGLKNYLTGSTLIFKGTGVKKYTSQRTGVFASGTYCVKTTPKFHTDMFGIGIVLDMDCKDTSGNWTSSTTDNRANYDFGYVIEDSPRNVHNDVTVFGYFPKAGTVLATREVSGSMGDPDYCSFTNFNTCGEYGLAIIGSLNATEAGGLSSRFSDCLIGAKDHHSRSNVVDDWGTTCIYIDGYTGATLANLNGQYFSQCTIRTYCNNPIILDKASNISFMQCVFETPKRGTPNSNKTQFKATLNNTFDVSFINNRFSEDAGLYEADFAPKISGKLTVIGEPYDDICVSEKNVGIRLSTDTNKPFVQFTNNLKSVTSGIRMIASADFRSIALQKDNVPMKTFYEDGAIGFSGYRNGGILTIDASGAISLTGSSSYAVSPTTNAILKTINGQIFDGQRIVLRPSGGGVTITPIGGNIQMKSDIILSSVYDRAEFEWSGSKWVLISFSDNA